jgi:hypothetical protein
MNDHEIERIAHAFHALRPDWPAASLRTMLTKRAQHMPRRDVCVQLAWIACDPNSSTPARMFETGPWKRAAAIEGEQTLRNVKAGQRCNDCGKDEHHPIHADDHPFERLHAGRTPAPENLRDMVAEAATRGDLS